MTAASEGEIASARAEATETSRMKARYSNAAGGMYEITGAESQVLGRQSVRSMP